MKKFLNHGALAGLGIAVALTVSAPAFAANTPAEAANKQVVLDFYAALNAADAAGNTKDQIPAIAEKYLSPEYKQQTIDIPGPGTDRDKLIKMFQSMPAMPAMPGAQPAPQRTDAVMAEGDKVMLLTSRPQPGPGGKRSYIFNMFRVKDGKLVEHWDVSAGGGAPPGAGAGGPPGGPGGPPGGPGGPPPGAQ